MSRERALDAREGEPVLVEPGSASSAAAIRPRGGVSRRATWLLLSSLVLFLYSVALQGARGLWSPDESRYTDVALQMLRGGDWIHPQLSREVPHYTKPPLTYWAIAASMKLLGRNEWAVRLPNSLAFLATVLVVVGIGRILLPARPWLPALVYATSAAPYLAASVVTTDTLLTLWETLAVGCFLCFFADPGTTSARRRRPFALLMWVAFGLAFLTKGPPGLLPLLVVVLFVGIRRRARGLLGLFHPAGLLAFLVIGMAWYVKVTLDSPELLGSFLGKEVVGRVFTGEHHRNPQWYRGVLVYGATLFAGGLPWLIPLFASLGRKARAKRPASSLHEWFRDESNALLSLWFCVPLLVFLLARSRLPLYILPLFVPLSVMVARRFHDRWTLRGRFWAALGVWAVFLMGIRGAAAWLPGIERDDRALAASLSALLPVRPGEVVFVETAPRYGLSLYLDTEVERLDLDRRPGTRETVGEELTNASREEPRVYLVPPERALDLERALAGRGRLPRSHGEVGGFVVYTAPAAP